MVCSPKKEKELKQCEVKRTSLTRISSTHTCNSPPQVSDCNDDGAELPPARCDWSDQDEIKLIRFSIEQKVKTGNSATFKSSICTTAAQHVEQFCTKGGPKTVKSCANKWTRVYGITFNTGSN